MDKNIDQILRNIIKDFDSFKILFDGTDNLIILVSKNHSKKIIRISKRIKNSSILFEKEINELLIEKKIPTPKWENVFFNEEFAGIKSIVVVMDFINGKSLNVKELDGSDISESAKLLARFHKSTYKHNFSNITDRNIFSELKRAQEHKNFIINLENGDDFIKQVDEYLNWAEKENDSNYLIHNDFRPQNILKDVEGKLYILDFDWVCKGSNLKDLGHALVEWSFPDGSEGPNFEIINLFLGSYCSVGSKIKFNNQIKKWMAFSCLSDTCTYLCDQIDLGKYEQDRIRSYMYKKFLYFNNLI